MTEHEKALALMQAGKKKTKVKLDPSADMNNVITKERIKTKDGSLAWREKPIPQYGMQSKTKVLGKVIRTTNEFGEQVLKEYDAKGKLVGESIVTEAPKRPKPQP